MRVIAGTARGRQLKAPPGTGTRPMTDRLKVSLFDTLVPYGTGGALVLDLYAGSGSLGIEMLSRGAASVDFVEQNRGVAGVIEENLRLTRLEKGARIYMMTVERFLSAYSPAAGTGSKDTERRYDIILLDPPYADPGIAVTIERISTCGLLEEDGIVAIGHATQVKLEEEYGGGTLRRVRNRVMGGSSFSIYEAAHTPASAERTRQESRIESGQEDNGS